MATQVKDIRLDVKARNNLLLNKMEEAGIWTNAEMCRRLNTNEDGSERTEDWVYQNTLGKLINMKLSARDKEGAWIPLALRLAEFFKCMPEDLFSEPQQYRKLEKNRAHAEVAFAEIQQLTARQHAPPTPEAALQASQLREAIHTMLARLTTREQTVIRMRFGFEDGKEHTLDDIGQALGCQGETIRIIESKALRKMRHPARCRNVLLAAGKKALRYRDSIEVDEDVLSAL